MEKNALRFGYRPPIGLLEWMMGYPDEHTSVELAASGMPLSLQSLNGLDSGSSLIAPQPKVSFEATGISFAQDLTYEEWERLGVALAKVEECWQWWIGDWVNYGEKKYGETYEQAMEMTGKANQTLRHIATVCRSVELCRRRHNLSFAHHQEVAPLGPDDQDKWLDDAADKGMSRNELRRQIKGDEPAEVSYYDRFVSIWEKADEAGKAAIRAFILDA
jgi:hypothetical protein